MHFILIFIYVALLQQIVISLRKVSDDPFYAFAKKMIETLKVVFIKILRKSQWVNTALATGNLTDEIINLKSEKGKDIIMYGGATLDPSLIKAGLIDEFHLFINPFLLMNMSLL